MLDDLMASLLGGEIGAAIVDLRERRRQRKAEEDVAGGRAPVIAGAIRRTTGSVWQRRWRHGLITIGPAKIRWRPRLRPWPRIELTDIRIQGRSRRPQGREARSLAPGVWIYRVTADGQREYELAALSRSRELFEQQIGRQA